MATYDSIEMEMLEIRKNMRGISPKLSLFKEYEKRLMILGQKLREIKDRKSEVQPKGLLDFDESYQPVFAPKKKLYTPGDNFEALQNLDRPEVTEDFTDSKFADR